MRVLHVITSLQTGGAETLVVNLMPRFRALGHEVGVVVFNGERTALMERLERECPECKIYRLGSSPYHPWHIVRLVRIMRNYDVVHTHNSSPQLFAAIANIVCRKKLITTEHNTNNRKRGHWLLSIVDKWMYPRYDKVICISDQAEENLREYLGDKCSVLSVECSKECSVLSVECSDSKKTQNSKPKTQNSKLSIKRCGNICTIYNGVDVDAIHQAMPIAELQTDRFVVVMVAGFRAQKDQDTLVRAMALLPPKQYELWLVGDGVRRQSVECLVLSVGVKDNVKFLGLRTDVPNILKTADVVVMSTHYEGLALSNIEGMAAGKPFVASDVQGIHEVTAGYGLLFPHEDADALAKIIRKLHDTPDYYQQVADKCYERAKQFDISKMVLQYNAVYCKTIR